MEWILTMFPQNSLIFQCRISALYFIKHDEEYLPEWIQPPTSLLDFRFRALIWTILRIGHWHRDRIYWLYSHHRKAHWCIESPSYSTIKSHTRSKLDSLLLFFQRSCDIISNLNNVPIISFSWRYRFDYHTRIEKSISTHLMHHVEIFFWSRQNTTLTTTIKSPLVWSKTSRSSSVVGAPSGRHSRLDPALSALHSLNDLILLLHD